MTEIVNVNDNLVKKGRLIVVSAPSGAGKTTICKRIINDLENTEYSISLTSRPPRPNETDGEDYVFLSREEFISMADSGELLEWAEVHDNFYGTSKAFVQQGLDEGKNIILDLDVQGGAMIKSSFPKSVLIFIMPPSMEELERRLRARSQDSDTEIAKRLRNADEEIKHASKYDYIVVNKKLEETVKEIKDIINNC